MRTKIDLTELQNEQRKLDENIHKNHNVDYKVTSNKRTLALLVELGELANEVRSFKFWSNKAPSEDKIILDEFADGLHFILSKCIAFDAPVVFEVDASIKKEGDKEVLTQAFLKLYSTASELNTKENLTNWLADYITLGFKLGYSLEQLKGAYLNKLKVNYDRQKNNY